MHSRLPLRLCGAVVLCAAAAPAYSGVIELEPLTHGEIVTNQFGGAGVHVSAINPNRDHDLAIIFNSSLSGTADPDLEGPPWAGGNLAPDTVLGNLLIIAENDIDADGDGLIDDPDDEGNRPAGSLILDFDFAIDSFGFDIVDVEGPFEEFGSVDFFSGGGLIGSVSFADLVDPGSSYFDPTISFGDNTANRIDPLSIDGASFDRVVINMGGSGGIDNFVFQQIPAPASLPLLLGAALVAHRRRRS